MGWANARRRVVVELGPDPADRIYAGLGRHLLRRAQGSTLPVVVAVKGDPEASYGGAYAPAVQANITGATNGVGSRSVFRDVNAQDIASGGVSEVSSPAARTFAQRLNRGRVVT